MTLCISTCSLFVCIILENISLIVKYCTLFQLFLNLTVNLQVCEYAIDVTNGMNPVHVIPMANRQAILQSWVAAKQMAQQQIAKTFGADDEVRF